MCNCERLGTETQVKEFESILEEYKGKKDNIMIVLQKTQVIFGYIPSKAIKMIAERLDMPESEIYGIISFYSFFTLTPKAKYNIDVCLGTACYVKGAQKIIDRLIEVLGIQPGECTADGKFSLEACRCIGACGLAPVLTVNEDVYGRLTEKDVDDIIAKYAD